MENLRLDDLGDRAFAASPLVEGGRLRDRVREAADAAHMEIRAHIRNRTLDRSAFLEQLARTPLELRDHLVEEILGIAYPPLSGSVPTESFDATSGLAEIRFMIERANLGSSSTFVDLGCGSGKVILLTALLTGARCVGIELAPHLAEQARTAAEMLGLRELVEVVEADLRTVVLPEADVYYMYIPRVGAKAILERLMGRRNFLLFSQPVDLPWLTRSNETSYWLSVHEANAEKVDGRGELVAERVGGGTERL